MYYIISLKHTHKEDQAIILLRSDTLGYTYHKESAGIYEQYKEGCHNSDGDMPVHVDILNYLFVRHNNYFVVPNCLLIWNILGVKMTKNGLVKKINKRHNFCKIRSKSIRYLYCNK